MFFNFVAVVTIHSDFGAQENKVCHCFHFFPKGEKQDWKELDVAYGVNELMAGPLIREGPCLWPAFGLEGDD